MRRTLFHDTRYPLAASAPIDPRDAAATGLVAWWPLVTAGGSRTFPGAAGVEPPLALSSPAPAWSPDPVVGAALAASGDAAWASIASSPRFNFSAITAAIWFRWSASGTNRAVFSRWSSPSESWILRAAGYLNRPAFNISTTGGNYLASSPASCNDDRWHHLVGTFDGASIRLYVDGLLHDSAAAAGSLHNPNVDIYLFRYSGAPTSGDYFIGSLADARLYSRALSAPEVWQLWDPATRWRVGAARRRRVSRHSARAAASATLACTTTASAAGAVASLAGATLAGTTAGDAHATLRRVTKSATFEPPAWGEFESGPTVAGAGAAITQSAAAAFIDTDAGHHEAGVRITLGAGDGSAYLEMPVAQASRSHARVMLRVPALSGGTADVLAAVDDDNSTLASLRLEPAVDRLRLVLPGGAAVSYTILPGDWNRWRCVEVTIDHTAGAGSLFIDGVEVGTAAASELVGSPAAAWRAGALYKDHAAAGTVDLDAWTIGPSRLGPPLVRATRDTLDDPARWLMVCNTAFAGSRDWAEAYRWARRIPHANVLALALPTTETIDATQAAALRAMLRDYLDAAGLSLQVAGVLLGPGVPGLVATDNPDTPQAIGDWLVGASASPLLNPHHAASVLSLARPTIDHTSGIIAVARMDAADADDAIALLTRALTIEHDHNDGDARRLFIDATTTDESVASAAERLDAWRASLDRMRLRVPTIAASEAETWSVFEHDGFFWGWRGATATSESFAADSGDRVFAFALPGSGGGSPLLRTTGGWARAAIDAGYASAATSAMPTGGDAVPDAGAFFESLRRGWTLAEAWLAACPKLGAGLTLVGDPLMRVTFPREGWDVYGPAASAEAIDFTRPTLALRAAEREAVLPEAARPIAEGKAVYAVRRVDEHGRSEAGLAIARIETIGGEIASSSPLAPAWPDYDGWPIGVSNGRVVAQALWDRPCRHASIASVTLEAIEAGGEPAFLATLTPGAWVSRVEASVAITSTPRRFRWRVVSSAGGEAVTPWSAPLSRSATDAIPLHVQET